MSASPSSPARVALFLFFEIIASTTEKPLFNATNLSTNR